MMDRIEKIARVKGIEHDIHRPFEHGQKEGGEKRKFSKTLAAAKKESEEREERSKIPDAYDLTISNRATQSLFYERKAVLPNLGARIHAK